MIRGSFQVPNMRWRVQKLVLLTAADMIDQKNQLREVAQCQKYSKTAAEVEKKVTTFGENIRPGQCQPYDDLIILMMMMMMIVRFVLKGAGYNPMDVLNCLMTRRGYKVIISVILIIINTAVIFAISIIFNVNNFNIIISTFFFITSQDAD